MAQLETLDEAREVNSQFASWLQDGMYKKAEDTLNSFTRLRVREDGFMRKILPGTPITNEELDRRIDDQAPWKVIDMETESPAAKSVPFGTLPDQTYMNAARYGVSFARIVSKRWMKDASELRTWQMDLRNVISDNTVKDVLAEEDSKFMACANAFMVGPDQTVPFTGGVHWKTIYGGMDRDSLQDMMKIMPSLPGHLVPERCLVNNVTIYEILKGRRDEFGGDLAQELYQKGWTMGEFMNMEWIVTIKRNLIPDNSIYLWAAPKFMGKLLILEEPTMWVNREAFMLEFFLYEELGMTIANPNSVCRADFV